jgi:hypothetical protein
MDIKNFTLAMPSNNFTIQEFNFYNLKIRDIYGSFNRNFEGILSFSFFDGIGNLIFKFNFIEPFFTGNFSIKNIDINKLTTSFNEKIIITGFMNIDGNFNISKDNFEIEAIFNSVKKRNIRQYMNFKAMELITFLSGTNSIKKMGSSNFYYKEMKGKISVKNNYLTIEGLAGEKGENQYLITKPFLLPGINILIDKKHNTIRIEEFINRVNFVIERIKQKN